MAFELVPQPGDRGEPEVSIGRVGGGAVGEERRLVADGVQILAWGSLACPCCSLPLSPAPRVGPRTALACGFCEHAAPAIEFFATDVVDTPANDARLVARFG